jgi:hypothetical protein
MRRDTASRYFLILILFLVVFTAACGGNQSVNLEDPQFQAALDTAVAGAVSTQAADFETTLESISAVESLAPTSTPVPDTPTPEPTQTTVSEIVPEITVEVSVDSNCRSGPGRVYPYQAGFFVGDQATVYGVDPSGAWLYIDHPDAPEGFCWIWGFYAIPSGDTDPLPIFTPGPTPDLTPDFSAEYRELEVCDEKWTVEFTIINTGPVTLQSVAVHVLNTDSSEQTGRAEMNRFQAAGGCEITSDLAQLDPGDTGYTISQELSEDPTGSLLYATITVCTEDNLAVSCLTKDFYFTP